MVAPPNGMRWQGITDVVVAVPDSWATETAPCGPAEHDAVRFLGPGTLAMRCPYIGPAGDASLLLIAPADLPVLPGARHLRHETTVHGLDARHGGVRCRASLVGPCSLTFSVPEANAAFEVYYRGPNPEKFVAAVRDSVTRVSDGYTTVPAIAYGTSVADAKSELAEAGLSGRSPDVESPHYAIGSQPEAGAVVEDGTTIELTIGDG
jgi:hypothetical protein